MKYQIASTSFGEFVVDTGDTVISKSLLVRGDFETDHIGKVVDFLQKKYSRLSRKSLFVDIGANIGTHVISSINKFGFKRGLAFEPSKINFTILRTNISLNNLCDATTLIRAAAGDKDSILDLALNSKNYGDHRISDSSKDKQSAKWLDSDIFEGREEIRVCKPNNFILDEIDQYDLVDSLCWIDTQGYEIPILKSLMPLMLDGMSTVIEFWPYGMICQGFTLEQFMHSVWDDVLEFHHMEAIGDRIEFKLLTKDDIVSLWEKLCKGGSEGQKKYAFTNILISSKITPGLTRRIIMTSRCRDADYINKVENAGAIIDHKGEKVQVMHNGIKISSGCYYGESMTETIRRCNGHHEPQEEKVFHHIEALVGNKGFMIELGCFWAYYSLWFLSKSKDRFAIGLEPEPKHIKYGIKNAMINNLNNQIKFINGACAKKKGATILLQTEKSGELHVQGYTVDHLLQIAEKSYIDILHCDTQGCEEFIVDQAIHLGKNGILRFCFFSTHAFEITGNPLTHQVVLNKLRKSGAWIIAEHDVYESYSGDGLIVASFESADRGLRIELSTNRYSQNIFLHPSIHLSKALSNK